MAINQITTGAQYDTATNTTAPSPWAGYTATPVGYVPTSSVEQLKAANPAQPGSTSGYGANFNAIPTATPQYGGANIASQVAAANNYSTAITNSAVFNANAALQDYQKKLALYQDTLGAVNQQSDMQSKLQAQAKADQAQKELQTSQQYLQQGSLDVQKKQAEAANTAAQAKLTASQGISSPNATQNIPAGWDAQTYANFKAANPTLEPTAEDTQRMSGQNSALKPSQDTLNYITSVQGIQDERTQALSTFLQTANTMIVGLQSSEAALVNATTQQFNNILKAQEQSNASQLGAAQEAAARTGQEFNPTGAGSTIANTISQGNQRLSEINSAMATTLANLDLNFAKEQYTMMNANFEKLDQSFTDRMSTFKEVHDAVAKDAAEQIKAQQDARDFAFKQKQDADKLKQDARDFEYKKGQDEILNNLNSAKFSYQQKQDAIDNAFKKQQINETQRHNMSMEAIAKEPTAKEKKETEDALKNAKASIPIMQDKVAAIDNLLKAPGMASRVGTSVFTRKPNGLAERIVKNLPGLGLGDAKSDLTGQGQDFAAGVHQLTTGLTLQNLIDAKARGATFGALSEGELSLLANSASKINDWEIKDSKGNGVGTWDIDEKSFKKELENVKTLTNRALLLSQGNIVSPDEDKQLDSLFPPTIPDPSAYYSN